MSSLDEKQDEYFKETPQQAVERLSKLSLIEYETIRIEEAKKLEFRPSALDKLVANERKDVEQSNDDVVTNDTPHGGYVDAEALLMEVSALIQKHMILPKGALPAVTLWIVSTYVYNSFRVFPKLAIISPEKRCGKTTLLDILGGLCSKGLIASNITPSAIFRSVDLWKPTLIIDEADTFMAGRNDDLIGIINSGHTKSTAFVIRTVGDDHTPKKFSTWSPMAFASIKGIVGTVMDRSIIIQLWRRTTSEKVARMPVDFKEDCELIRQKLVKWGEDNAHLLKTQPVEPPEIPNDRAIDNWLPLFTVAHAIGGKWPEKIEASYFTLNSREEEETAAILLLRNIKGIFEVTGWPKIHSETLVEKLIALEERPWSEWKKGQPMTQNSLARILKTFSIHSKDVRVGISGKNRRGYELNKFKDAFMRYLPNPPIQSATVLQTSSDGGCSGIQSATNPLSVALEKGLQATGNGTCSTVALQNTRSEKVATDKGVF